MDITFDKANNQAIFENMVLALEQEKIVNNLSVFNRSKIALSVTSQNTTKIEVYEKDTFELIYSVEPDFYHEKDPGLNMLKLGPISMAKNPNDYKLIYEVQDKSDETIFILNEVHFYESGEIFEFPNLLSFYDSDTEKSLANK